MKTPIRVAEFRVALSELLIVLLPLLVLALVIGFNNGNPLDVLDDAEWSFAAAILMGQTVVKYVSRTAGNPEVRNDVSSLIVAALIVLAVVPTLIVLSFVLNTKHPMHPEHTGLIWTQCGMFIASVILFMIFGTLVGRGPRMSREQRAPYAAEYAGDAAAPMVSS